MVYQRRYFAALTITTISYAPKSITAEKLADGAVTHPKLAPGSVDSERVIDESLRSEDIKDGEIKSVDLQDGSVTTPKIASAAVTPEKLSAAVATRPLTPGVTTAEILDANVTLAKLAPDSVDASKIKPGAVGPSELAVDAVEESRVKDGAISREKIAGSAIDSTKISVGAVDGSAILNRSVGTTEIAIDGVQFENIKDLHVTEPKLNLNAISTRTIIEGAVTEPKIATAAFAARHKNSFTSRVIDVGEEFGGAGLSDKWVKTLSIGGVVYQDNDKGLLIKSGSGAGWPSRIDFGGQTIGQPGTIRPIMDIWITERNFNDYFTTTLGLWNDSNNYIAFYANAPGAPAVNWFAHCKVGGVLTAVDTGVQVSTGIQLLSIEVESSSRVVFYINGVEVAVITTNIPAAVAVEPYLTLESRGVADKTMLIKYVSLLLVRPDYP